MVPDTRPVIRKRPWRSVVAEGPPSTRTVAPTTGTSRIRLLTAVLWPLHQPILSFADEMANIDNLSGGRLSLGLSNGSWPGEGDRDGSRPKAGGRLQETITVLKSLWLEPEVSFKGSHFNLEGASLNT
ncbi:MAG TPA: LLM class flavin-dependent oxidoreductase, partial [Anaerolineae bacterium]|nr:LLM class flavin-dependent oxidoreductase [Anaerolineae bacterium]